MVVVGTFYETGGRQSGQRLGPYGGGNRYVSPAAKQRRSRHVEVDCDEKATGSQLVADMRLIYHRSKLYVNDNGRHSRAQGRGASSRFLVASCFHLPQRSALSRCRIAFPRDCTEQAFARRHPSPRARIPASAWPQRHPSPRRWQWIRFNAKDGIGSHEIKLVIKDKILAKRHNRAVQQARPAGRESTACRALFPLALVLRRGRWLKSARSRSIGTAPRGWCGSKIPIPVTCSFDRQRMRGGHVLAARD